MERLIKKYKIKRGDILYFAEDEKNYEHAAIIYKVKDDTLLYSAHTDSYKDKDIRKFFVKNPKGRITILKLKDCGVVEEI